MTAPYYSDDRVTLYHGDCLDVLRSMPDASVDSVCTDPPYGLEFMGKDWDKFRPDILVNRGAGAPGRAAWDDTKLAPVEYGGAKQRSTLVCDGCGKSDKFKNAHDCPEGTGWTRQNLDTSVARIAYARAFQRWCEEWAAECLRVLKPGGHLLAFGGTRTWHRLACAVEDAGFEIRDSIAWLYGSGFPKSLDVSKAIDKAAGRLATQGRGFVAAGDDGRAAEFSQDKSFRSDYGYQYAPATDAAREWAGWGTALKPAFEPVVVARKPLTGTVAGNVLEWGTGALNIDGCRIGVDLAREPDTGAAFYASRGIRYPVGDDPTLRAGAVQFDGAAGHDRGFAPAGRWPANVVLDEAMADVLDEQSGTRSSPATYARGVAVDNRDVYGDGMGRRGAGDAMNGYGDSGGASRFFYVAKAPKRERPVVDGVAHPTVKPLTLMRWLVRLVTPPGGTVLEPFAGSGTTVEACIAEGFRCVAVEKGDEYLPLILERIRRQDAARIADEVTRRPDPDAAIVAQFVELGLFDLDDEEGEAS